MTPILILLLSLVMLATAFLSGLFGMAGGYVLGCALALGLWSGAVTCFDAIRQARALPELGSFEDGLELTRWSFDGVTARRDASHVVHGSWSLRIALEPGDYPGVTLTSPPTDWSAYEYLGFDLFVEGDLPLQMELKIEDGRHSGAYEDRFNRTLALLPGWNRVLVALADVASAPRELYKFPQLTPDAVSAPDGRSVLASTLGVDGWDIVRISLDSSGPPVPFGSSRATDFGPRFSPDGRWAALTSAESGRMEVYVRSYPDATAKLQVSVGGGAGPIWSADGRKLYYLSGDAVIAARLETGTAAVRVLGRDTAFRSPARGRIEVAFGAPEVDITRDGSRAVVPAGTATTFELIVVPNWLREFRERLTASRPQGR